MGADVGDVINLLEKAAFGLASFIVPLAETTPDFEERLSEALKPLLRASRLKVSAINFPNERGEQIMLYSIDVVAREMGMSRLPSMGLVGPLCHRCGIRRMNYESRVAAPIALHRYKCDGCGFMECYTPATFQEMCSQGEVPAPPA